VGLELQGNLKESKKFVFEGKIEVFFDGRSALYFSLRFL